MIPQSDGYSKLPESAPDPVAEIVASGAAGAPQNDSTFRQIASGTGWSGIGLAVPLLFSLLLTPYFIHHFGLVQWGLIALVQAVCTFLGTFDGGLGLSAVRHFSVLAGNDDRATTTRLVTTLVALLSVVAAVFALGGWFAAPVVIRSLNLAPHLRGPTETLLRTVIPLVGLGSIYGLFTAVLNARQDFRRTTGVNVAAYLIWASGLIVTVHVHAGLRGVTIVFLGQQILAALLIFPAAGRYLTKAEVRFVSRVELRKFLSYSWKVQGISIFAILNFGADALLVGILLPVKDVAYYDIGASLALQLRSVMAMALLPSITVMGNTFGRRGWDRSLVDFSELQRTWVACVTGWCCVGMASLYFGILAWLGTGFWLAGATAVILLGGHFFNLTGGMATAYTAVIGRPDVDLRGLVVITICNAALTLPGALLGLLGIVGATAFGMALGMIYFVRILRQQIDPTFPNYIRCAPVLPAISAAAVTVGLELVFRTFIPSGPIGLLCCAVPALIGLGIFTALNHDAQTMAQKLVTVARSAMRRHQ